MRPRRPAVTVRSQPVSGPLAGARDSTRGRDDFVNHPAIGMLSSLHGARADGHTDHRTFTSGQMRLSVGLPSGRPLRAVQMAIVNSSEANS